MNGLVDLIEAVKNAQGKGTASQEVQKAMPSMMEPMPFEAILIKSEPDSSRREILKQMLVNVYKEVDAVDLGAVRIISLYPQIAQARNQETKTLNILESAPIWRSTDYQNRFPEERIGTETAIKFNLDQSSVLDELQSNLQSRTNTTGAVGQAVKISFMAEELAGQGPYRRDELASQISFAMTRIRRTMNSMLISNVEQTNEAPNVIPQPGGLVTRSTANNLATSGNLTDALIKGRIDAMAATFGYDYLQENVVALTSASQIPVVRDLMINRYPGTDPMSMLQYDNVLMRRLKSVGVDVQMVYMDDNGVVIPFIRETALPAGTTLFFDVRLPRLGKFQMLNQYGPFLLERPNTTLFSLLYMFDLFTLIDPLIESRAVLSGLS
jgi:hypothetical protein